MPNRKFLEQRLKRFERNTMYITEHLSKTITQIQGNIEKIVYPGLPTHPSFSWSKTYVFHGSYFVLQFKNKFRNVATYKRFVNCVMKAAKKSNVSINGGTSFGFDTTRIYITARNSDNGIPFVRVSMGTESISQIERITDVFREVIQSF